MSDGFNIFAKVGEDGALWGPLFEKAFAKLVGTYEDLVSGDTADAIELLTGGPTTSYPHTDSSARELFNLVKQANEAEDMITASTGGGSNR